MADILIIDDEPAMLRVMVRILERVGHTVRQAPNGREGIEMFRRQRPAVVISDIIMPDTEGIETILTLRAEAPTLPIIAVSGSTYSLYLRAASGLGAVMTLGKPFAAHDLVAAVEWALATTAA